MQKSICIPVLAEELTVSSGPAAMQHHRGLFIRPDLGFGYVSANASPGGTDLCIAGAAASLGIAAGGAIARNQILAIHFWDFIAENPNVTTGDLKSASANSGFALFALGPEYTFYSNANYYLSASPALTRINYLSHGSASSSNFGYGLRASFGKEWWASENWGLGVAAQVSESRALCFSGRSGLRPPLVRGFHPRNAPGHCSKLARLQTASAARGLAAEAEHGADAAQ
jgi:hypothetical protein